MERLALAMLYAAIDGVQNADFLQLRMKILAENSDPVRSKMVGLSKILLSSKSSGSRRKFVSIEKQ